MSDDRRPTPSCARSPRTCTSAGPRPASVAGGRRFDRQHAAGKLTGARAHELLVDAAVHGARHPGRGSTTPWRGCGREAPADGVITATGGSTAASPRSPRTITVMAGSDGDDRELKVARLRELALTKRMPFVWLLTARGRGCRRRSGSLFAGPGPSSARRSWRAGHPAGRGVDGPCAAGRRTSWPRGLRADGAPGAGRWRSRGAPRRAAVGRGRQQEELGGSRVTRGCRRRRSEVPTTRSASPASSST